MTEGIKIYRGGNVYTEMLFEKLSTSLYLANKRLSTGHIAVRLQEHSDAIIQFSDELIECMNFIIYAPADYFLIKFYLSIEMIYLFCLQNIFTSENQFEEYAKMTSLYAAKNNNQLASLICR